MDLDEVCALCRLFDAEGLAFWLDGGWGVDALLGEQTRPHSDLDLAVERAAFPAFARVLASRGYRQEHRPNDPEWNPLYRRSASQSVDLHGFTLDAAGHAVLGRPEEGNAYPAGALEGVGQLGERSVRCVAAPFVLRFRTSFPPRPVDRHDVARLCAKFGLSVPAPFRREDG